MNKEKLKKVLKVLAVVGVIAEIVMVFVKARDKGGEAIETK